MMFVVYEVFNSDGKRFPMFYHKDRFDCEVWAANHSLDMISVQAGRAKLVIEESEGGKK